NVVNALGFMWNPKTEGKSVWQALANPELWLNASGQIFFTLSVGFGIVLNYASYLRRDDDVVLSGLTASSTNEFCEVCLGGLITVPVAFLFLGAENLTKDVLGSSFSLGFIALPTVFARMPAGWIFGAVWFFMLFVAAITSSLSMLQPAIAFFEEAFGMGRRLSVTCLGLLGAIGSLLVVYFSKNLLALDTLDFWIGGVCIFCLATVEVILAGWVFGIRRLRAEAGRGAALRVPSFFWFIIKYISPAYLLGIFGLWCYYNLPQRIRDIRGMSSEDRGTVLLILSLIVLLLVFFGLLINLAGKRWRAMGKTAVAAEADYPDVRAAGADRRTSP
ncbi:MAG: sodium:calcium symporter, partial [Planctomycetes bacterium]|nr:sodium:calcium symporter [Planctomycetota bacterium]